MPPKGSRLTTALRVTVVALVGGLRSETHEATPWKFGTPALAPFCATSAWSCGPKRVIRPVLPCSAGS